MKDMADVAGGLLVQSFCHCVTNLLMRWRWRGAKANTRAHAFMLTVSPLSTSYIGRYSTFGAASVGLEVF